MATIDKVALARIEGAADIPDTCSCWAVENLSSEDLYVSMVTGIVVNKGGQLVRGGSLFFAGQIEPDQFRKIYYSCRQPNVRLRIYTDADARATQQR